MFKCLNTLSYSEFLNTVLSRSLYSIALKHYLQNKYLVCPLVIDYLIKNEGCLQKCKNNLQFISLFQTWSFSAVFISDMKPKGTITADKFGIPPFFATTGIMSVNGSLYIYLFIYLLIFIASYRIFILSYKNCFASRVKWHCS